VAHTSRSLRCMWHLGKCLAPPAATPHIITSRAGQSCCLAVWFFWCGVGLLLNHTHCKGRDVCAVRALKRTRMVGCAVKERRTRVKALKATAMALSSIAVVLVVLTFWDQCFVNFIAAEGNVKIMEFLIRRGVNLNRECKRNYPLIVAARSRRAEMVSFLLKNGADPNVRADDLSTALVWAAKQSSPEIAEKLIEAGADVNLQDRLGGSSLWYAVRSDNYPLVLILMRAGAIVRKGPGGITPQTLARQNGDGRITKLLSNGTNQPKEAPFIPR
jgi:uncharacterized protein